MESLEIRINEIRTAYNLENYETVIDLWELNKFRNREKKILLNDPIVLQAIVVSYFKLNRYKESLFHINTFANKIKKDLNNYNSQFEIDYIELMYIAKMSMHSKNKEIMQEYRAMKQYIKLGGDCKKLKIKLDDLEEILFSKFRTANLYYAYIFTGLAAISYILKSVFLLPLSYLLFSTIFSSLSVIWISMSLLSRKVSWHLFKTISRFL
jgi:hypothetical protein